MKRTMAILAILATILAAILAAAVCLSSCEDFLNAILNSDAPSGVDASDGDNENSIHVSWNAPSFSEEDAKTHGVDHYRVSWTGLTNSNSVDLHPTSYDIPVAPENRGEEYDVTVESWISVSGIPEYGGSDSDTGFALKSRNLSWLPDWRSTSLPDDAGLDTWFVTMFQEGFTYHFDSGGVTTSIVVYDFEDVSGSIHAIDMPAGIGSWRCDEGGNGHKFYLRVPSTPLTLAYHYSP
ncbi:MAG: hypothetical protein NT080_01380 [Spirochaetes bacterium]|nr:hypothetical protein [Spirochaetota bacterium]